MTRPRSAAARSPRLSAAAERISVVRTALAALLVVAGIAWVVYYAFWVFDDGRPAKVADLGQWNFALGFGLLFLGLVLAAHSRTPLGRGRGVVVGMLGTFLVGLTWIVVYYVTSQEPNVPLISELGNYNLLVGVGFMATGFVFATRWE